VAVGIQHTKEESLKPVGISGFFLELLADLFAFLLLAKIKVRLRPAVGGDARPYQWDYRRDEP